MHETMLLPISFLEATVVASLNNGARKTAGCYSSSEACKYIFTAAICTCWMIILILILVCSLDETDFGCTWLQRLFFSKSALSAFGGYRKSNI